MIDSHAHLMSEFYDDIDLIVENAKSNDINIILNTADNIESSKEVLETYKKYNNLIPLIGVHPEHTEDLDKLDILEDLIKNNKIYGIGEIGLDYYYGTETKEKQILLLKKQLDLATKYNLPIVVHSREATADTLSILKEYNLKGIIHCFSGSVETAKEYIKLGYKLGVNGVVTFKNNKKTKEVIQTLGIDNFVLETDCPFLSPEPNRGTKNEPKNIKYIAEFLSDLLDISTNKIKEITNKNVCEIFDLDITI